MPFPMIDVRATGQNIHHLLKQRQISIRTLQAYFGFDSPRAIYRWLRGANLPTVDNLFALSKLLRVPMQDILIEQKEGGQDVPFLQGWRLFDLIQRNLSGGSRFSLSKNLRVASEGSQALRFYIENRRHARRFSRDFACKIASLHERTAGRAACSPTSERVQNSKKWLQPLF